MHDRTHQTATEWMEQQISELEREAPDLVKWVQTGIRPQGNVPVAAQKSAPRPNRRKKQ